MDGSIVELTPSVAPAKLQAAQAAGGRLQCSRQLSDGDCAKLDAFLREHPQVLLRVYKAPKSSWDFDLGFLARLPSLRHAWIEADAGDLNDLRPLEALPAALRTLTLDTVAQSGDSKRDKPKQNADSLRRFTALTELVLCGQFKDLAFLPALTGLQRLGLWRNKLASLAGVEALPALRYLELRTCGAKDLTPLAALDELRALEISNERGLAGLAVLSGLRRLQRLWLIACGASLQLPSLADLPELRVLVLDKLATPHNLQAAASARGLRCLILSGSGKINPDDFQPLAGHPSLRELRIESFNEKLWKAISDRYGWKVDYCNYPADEHLSA